MADTELRAPCQVCGEELDTCIEQRRLTLKPCCPVCLARETHATPEPAEDHVGSPSRAERALIRTLADIDFTDRS